MNQRFLLLVSLLASAGLASFSTAARADTWPSKPIRFVVPFTAGGAADIARRAEARVPLRPDRATAFPAWVDESRALAARSR